MNIWSKFRSISKISFIQPYLTTCFTSSNLAAFLFLFFLTLDGKREWAMRRKTLESSEWFVPVKTICSRPPCVLIAKSEAASRASVAGKKPLGTNRLTIYSDSIYYINFSACASESIEESIDWEIWNCGVSCLSIYEENAVVELIF